MVLKPDPIFRALDAIAAERGKLLTVIMTSPQGRRFHPGRRRAVERAGAHRGAVRALRGVRRAVRERVTEELSIGDYVLTGGELPALVVLDAVARLRAGRRGRPAVGRAGYVQPGLAEPSAVHAAARDRDAPRARRADVGATTPRSGAGGSARP